MNFPDKYKTASLTNGRINILEKQFPKENLSESFIVIKPFYMGICRADVKEVTNSRDIPEDRGPLFGHEIVGKIEYAGKETGFIENQTVTFNPNITPNRTTGFAEYFFINGKSTTLRSAIIPLPDSLKTDPPFTPEPFACIVHSLKIFMQKSGNTNFSGKNVCIIGAGNSGLMFGFLARFFGAKVTILNRGQMRIKFAKDNDLFSTGELDFLANLPKYNNFFDLVIVVPTKIDQDTLKIAYKIVRSDGFIHLYGGTRKGDLFLDTSTNIDDIRRNELFTSVNYQTKKLHISGAYGCLVEDFNEGFAFYQKNPQAFPLQRLISKTIPLSEFPETMLSIASGENDFPGKVLVIN